MLETCLSPCLSGGGGEGCRFEVSLGYIVREQILKVTKKRKKRETEKERGGRN